jgi:hypothetical protein
MTKFRMSLQYFSNFLKGIEGTIQQMPSSFTPTTRENIDHIIRDVSVASMHFTAREIHVNYICRCT